MVKVLEKEKCDTELYAVQINTAPKAADDELSAEQTKRRTLLSTTRRPLCQYFEKHLWQRAAMRWKQWQRQRPR